MLQSGPYYFLQPHKVPILYSIQLLDGVGPMVHTCMNHDKGSEFHYLHPPTFTLTGMQPSCVGDPIGQVALVPHSVTTTMYPLNLPFTFSLALYLLISPVEGFLFLFICHTLESSVAPLGILSFLISLYVPSF